MKIGELAKRTGVAASAIRYYEQEKLLPAPARVSGRRVYSLENIVRVRLIHNARSLGFTIRELKLLTAGIEKKPPGHWKRFVEGKIREFDEKLMRLSTMREVLTEALQCNCIDVTECQKTLDKT